MDPLNVAEQHTFADAAKRYDFDEVKRLVTVILLYT
jgi:hypothetical protein